MKILKTPAGAALAGGLAVAVAALAVASPVGANAGRMITGRDIRNNSISGKDIKNKSVTSYDIANGTLRKKDFAAGVLPTSAPTPSAAPQPTVVRYADTYQASGTDDPSLVAQQSAMKVPAHSLVQPVSLSYGPELAAACPSYFIEVYLGDDGAYNAVFAEQSYSGRPVRRTSFPYTTDETPKAITVAAQCFDSSATTAMPVPAFTFDVRLSYTTGPTTPTTTFGPGTRVTPNPGIYTRGAKPFLNR